MSKVSFGESNLNKAASVSFSHSNYDGPASGVCHCKHFACEQCTTCRRPEVYLFLVFEISAFNPKFNERKVGIAGPAEDALDFCSQGRNAYWFF